MFAGKSDQPLDRPTHNAPTARGDSAPWEQLQGVNHFVEELDAKLQSLELRRWCGVVELQLWRLDLQVVHGFTRQNNKEIRNKKQIIEFPASQE